MLESIGREDLMKEGNMEMNKEEIGQRMKTKRKEGIKRAASPTKSKTGSHLLNVPLGNFF